MGALTRRAQPLLPTALQPGRLVFTPPAALPAPRSYAPVISLSLAS
ncbi:hypothetical protein [Kitasatospora sp. NPDC090091]